MTFQWRHAAREEMPVWALINTSFRPLSRFCLRLRPRDYPHAGRPLAGQSFFALEQFICAMPSNHRAMTAAVLRAALRYERPVSSATAVRLLTASASLLAPSTRPPSGCCSSVENATAAIGLCLMTTAPT